MTKSVIVDGIPVQLDDVAHAAVIKLQDHAKKIEGENAALKDAASKASGEAEAKLADAKAQIDKLTADLKARDDGLEQAIADRAAALEIAKSVIPAFDGKGKTNADIKRAVVGARLGDAAKGKDDVFVGAAFDTLVAANVIKAPISAHSGDVKFADDATKVVADYKAYLEGKGGVK
jgi:hypothetical protein